MDQQPLLQETLEMILGSEHVYFQPPSNVQMEYPAIVYSIDFASSQFADNNPYRRMWRYQVTYIDRKPLSEVPDKIATLPMCLFKRFFAAENLNHYVFDLYF